MRAKNIIRLFFLLLFGSMALSCAKTYSVAQPKMPKIYQKSFSATPNDIYYALRWVFRSFGYPIAEEDLQNGVIKSRYVPVKATSHYVKIFGRKDYGVTGAYHQLEARLVPKGGGVIVQVGSRFQGIVASLKSTGREENLVLDKVSDYLRSPSAQVTNQGLKE